MSAQERADYIIEVWKGGGWETFVTLRGLTCDEARRHLHAQTLGSTDTIRMREA